MNEQEAFEIDSELRAIAVARRQLLAREAVLLVRAEEIAIWRAFGCASLLDYLERRCDVHPRTAKDYLRVARCLTELPLLRTQLEAGRIVYSTARELTRVATADTEAEWLRETAGLSPREVEEAVAGHKKGDWPDSPRDPDRMVKLVLEVRESTYAQFVEARTRYADERGERLSDDELVVALCRPTAAADDARRAPYRMAITTCRSCKKSFQVGGGREIEVRPSVVERARCDAQHLGDLEAEAPTRLHRTIGNAAHPRTGPRARRVHVPCPGLPFTTPSRDSPPRPSVRRGRPSHFKSPHDLRRSPST